MAVILQLSCPPPSAIIPRKRRKPFAASRVAGATATVRTVQPREQAIPNIDFSNVNISIHQFQEISTGEINAGEVRLADEHTLDKINNRAHWRGSNTVTLSHHEVLAIKNAFVRTLSDSGVGADEINRIRQELGLAPRKPVDTFLLDRSIRPLSRQQTREILDQNAGTINAHVGAGTIRTSEELQARLSPGRCRTAAPSASRSTRSSPPGAPSRRTGAWRSSSR